MIIEDSEQMLIYWSVSHSDKSIRKWFKASPECYIATSLLKVLPHFFPLNTMHTTAVWLLITGVWVLLCNEGQCLYSALRYLVQPTLLSGDSEGVSQQCGRDFSSAGIVYIQYLIDSWLVTPTGFSKCRKERKTINDLPELRGFQ